VIIANYNYRDFVGRCDRKCASQSIGRTRRWIVVDDASTDDSRTIIERFQGRVAAYFRAEIQSIGRSYMFGFEQSNGEINHLSSTLMICWSRRSCGRS